MNYKFILTLLLVFFAISTFAAKKKGWYITPAGDTIQTTFRIPVNLFARAPNFEQLQWKVKFTDDFGRSGILKPDQAREFSFLFRSLPVKMIAMPNILHASNAGANPEPVIFLQLVKEGKSRLFRFYEYSGYEGTDQNSPDPVLKEAPGSIKIYLLQRPGEELRQLRNEEGCEPFPDCFH
ncbi:MAG: hypothetical protein JXA23_00785 [Bacteroidales bacterium]|nr:hypothetical protein [Bacteroidales bacterium]